MTPLLQTLLDWARRFQEGPKNPWEEVQADNPEWPHYYGYFGNDGLVAEWFRGELITFQLEGVAQDSTTREGKLTLVKIQKEMMDGC